MSYPHHTDPTKKWNQQYYSLTEQAKILEIDCGEVGMLKAFSDLGFSCIGIDLIELKDAIEHIYAQEKMLNVLHKFLKKNGPRLLLFHPLKYVPFFLFNPIYEIKFGIKGHK